MAKHILVVDDSATMRKAIELTFTAGDFRVSTAETGDEALGKAHADAPALFILDTTLHGKSGYDIAAAIRADANLKSVPILLLSSRFAPYDEARGKASGVDAHLDKPFDTQALIDKAGELAGKPASAVAASPVALAAPAPSVPAPAPPAPAPKPAAPPVASPMPPAPSAPIPVVIAPAQSAPIPVPKPAPMPAPMPAPAPMPTPAPMAARNGGMAERVQMKISELTRRSPEHGAMVGMTREAIEKIVWEVVPELAEVLIREEIDRLVAARGAKA